jgi:glycosyltransferase involved in cell wall biosynthesis
MNIEFEQFVPQSFDSNWENIDTTYISNVYMDPDAGKSEGMVKLLKRRIANKIKKIMTRKESGFNWIGKHEKERFRKIIMDGHYVYVIFSYIYYAGLINELPKDSISVLLLEDFVTAQEYQDRHCKLGVMFEDEIGAIDRFDYAICVSMDEMALYSNFVEHVKLFYLPHFFERVNHQNVPKDVDIMFLASDNRHNQHGIIWFLDHVFPLIETLHYKIVIAGKISGTLEQHKYPTILFVQHISETVELYDRARLAISPLHSGTGLKIKIVEAMGYGVPVVCTFKSLIGFPNKGQNGCLISDDAIQFAEYIRSVISDNDLRERLSLEGTKQYELYFNPTFAKKVLSEIFEEESQFTHP